MYLLSKEHALLYRKFKKCVDEKSIERMDKKLYHFFIYHCGFIAHYNIHGFRDEYSDMRFLEWFEVFANPNWMFFLPHGDAYHELKKACVEYAKTKQHEVYTYFERLNRNRKMKLLQSLSNELGISLGDRSNKESTPSLTFYEEEDGQLSLFV